VHDRPPSYAWDWLTRQRVTWHEIRRRLMAEDPRGREASDRPRPIGTVPDWAADHPDLRLRSPTTPAVPPGATEVPSGRHDYRLLETRAEVIAALRVDYGTDADLRGTVDAVIAEVAFLGRLDVPLHELGVRSAPRGMRWWWSHLGGTGPADGRSTAEDGDEHGATLPTQLRLMDVLAGYGDVQDT